MNLEQQIRNAKLYYKKHHSIDEREFTNQVIEKLHTPSRTPSKSVFRYKTAIGVGISACALLLIGVTPVMATAIYHIPKDNFVSEWFHGLGQGTKLVESLNTPVTTHGITVTLTNVLYDNGGLNIGYTVTPGQSNFPYGGVVNERSLSFEVNGKPTELPWAGSNGKAGDGYTGLIQLMNVSQLPDSFDLKVTFHQIGKQKGDWAFSVPVSRSEANALTKTFTPSESHTYGSDTVTVEKVEVGPATTIMDFKVSSPQRDWGGQASQFWVVDDQGHPLRSEYGGPIGTPTITNGIQTGTFREVFISSPTTPKFLMVSAYGSGPSPLPAFQVPLVPAQ